jgi:hypothetical protein
MLRSETGKGTKVLKTAVRYLRRHHWGLIATFIALTGTAYAATVAANTVKSSSIKNGQVKTQDLANGAVTAAKASNVKRIAFRPTGCTDTPADDPGCVAPIANFSGLILTATCVDATATAGGPVVRIDASGATIGVNFNWSAVIVDNPASESQPDNDTHVGYHSGAGTVMGFDASPSLNGTGVLTIQRGSAEVISVPFHVFLGTGTNCVFEGSAIRS